MGILDRQNAFRCLFCLWGSLTDKIPFRVCSVCGDPRQTKYLSVSVCSACGELRQTKYLSVSVVHVGILDRRNTFQHWVDYCGYSDVLDLDGSLKFPFNASHTAAKLPILQPVRVHLHYDKYGLWSPMFVYFTYIKTCREITIATDLCTT